MHVNFVTTGGPHLVSYRGRIEVPAKYLVEQGWQVTVGPYVKADVHVFSKHFDRDGNLNRIKQSPCGIFDLCDDHSDKPQLWEYYREMLKTAKAVVTSSDALSKLAGGTTIHEPYELPQRPVRTPTEKKALWYGHHTNLYTLRPFLQHLKAWDWEVQVITNPGVGDFAVKTHEFSLEKQAELLDWCHVVLLPQPKAWKNPNRAVEAIRAGRFPLMDDIPAYRMFGLPVGHVWERLDATLEGDWTAQLTAAQAFIDAEFSPERIGKQWYDCILAAVGRSSPATSTSTAMTSALML